MVAPLKVYSYSWATGELIGEDRADVSPLEPDKWILPAYCTPKAPPEEIPPGHRPIFDRETDQWIIEPIPAAAAPEPVFELTGAETIGELFDEQH